MNQILFRRVRIVAVIGIIGATIGFAGWQLERLTSGSGALESGSPPPRRVYRGRLTRMQDGYRYAVRFSSRHESRDAILVDANGSFDFGLLRAHSSPLDFGVVTGPPSADGEFPPVVWGNLFSSWGRPREDPFPDVHRLPAHELVSISVRGAEETTISVVSRWDHQTQDGPEAQFVLRDDHLLVIAQSSTGAIASHVVESAATPGPRDVTTPREIVLDLTQSPERTVRFVDTRGQPLADCTIQLQEFRGIRTSGRSGLPSMTTNALGETPLLQVDPGVYEVSVWSDPEEIFTTRMDLTRASDVMRLDLEPESR